MILGGGGGCLMSLSADKFAWLLPSSLLPSRLRPKQVEVPDISCDLYCAKLGLQLQWFLPVDRALA